MPDDTSRGARRFGTGTLVATVAAAAVAAAAVAALLTSIFQHKQEERNPFFRVVTLTDTTQDPAVWGKNFPLQYDDYRRTTDMVRTRYGGSEALPRDPTATDPRDTVSESRLVEDPRLVEFWAGYAFSKDFREERGHAYMLADQEFTERQHVIQDRTYQLRNIALDAVVQLTRDIRTEVQRDSVAAAARIAAARGYQRRAQFYADFIEAENSMGFHADQEAARILAKSIDFARRGQIALAGGTALETKHVRQPPQLVTPGTPADTGKPK